MAKTVELDANGDVIAITGAAFRPFPRDKIVLDEDDPKLIAFRERQAQPPPDTRPDPPKPGPYNTIPELSAAVADIVAILAAAGITK